METNNTDSTKQKMDKSILIVLFILFFCGAMYVVITGFIKKDSPQDPPLDQSESGVSKNYPDDLHGKIYMTLNEKATGDFGIYAFDLDENKLEKVYVPQGCYALGGEISPTTNEMAVSTNCGIDAESSHIQVLDLNTNELGRLAVPELNGGDKKETVWSDDGESLAFMLGSKKGEGEDTKDFIIENWNIYTTDLRGQEKFVAVATHPFFSPDGKMILALRKEGLFLFDLGTEEGVKVHTFEIGVSASIQMDLSEEKDLLVVADPVQKNLAIFQIKSWDPFEMEKIDEIQTEGAFVSWPKFSSDNKYVLDEELFENGDIELVAYNLETKTRHFLLNLNEYEHGSLWINDWK